MAPLDDYLIIAPKSADEIAEIELPKPVAAKEEIFKPQEMRKVIHATALSYPSL